MKKQSGAGVHRNSRMRRIDNQTIDLIERVARTRGSSFREELNAAVATHAEKYGVSPKEETPEDTAGKEKKMEKGRRKQR